MFVCMDIHTPEESFGSHRTTVIGGCESACECWELNLGPERGISKEGSDTFLTLRDKI